MNNIRLLKIIFILIAFIVQDILFSYTTNTVCINDMEYRYLGDDKRIEPLFKRMLCSENGKLKSVAYKRFYYPEDSFGIVIDSKVAIDIAKIIFRHRYNYRTSHFEITNPIAGVWRVSGARVGLLQPTIYIQKEDAKILRIVSKSDKAQKVFFVKEDVRLWKSDSTVAKLNAIIDSPEFACQFGMIVLATYTESSLQKPLIVTSIKDTIWQVDESRNEQHSCRVAHVLFDKKNCMVLGLFSY